jgi:FkbM family methyltransferase
VRPLLRPLARLAFNVSVAHRRVREVRVRAGELAGARLLLDLRYEKAYWLGGHEPAIQAALVRLVDPGDVVYDVGAHAGFFAVLAQRAAGLSGRVVAFEPNPDVAERLRRNLELNGGAPARVVARPVASEPGAVFFVAGPTPQEDSLRPPPFVLESSARRRPLELEAITLDGIVEAGERLPDVIKIDVERGELAVLQGAREVVAAARPQIVCEVHAWAAPAETLAYAAELGLTATHLDRRPVSAAGIEETIRPDGSAAVLLLPEDR